MEPVTHLSHARSRAPSERAQARPKYALRARRLAGAGMEVQIGQLPSTAAPHIRQHMAAVAAGIEAMPGEQAGYWLGMTMHCKFPRRVLMALRCLLIDPKA